MSVGDDKERRILDAALKAFAARGYYGTAVPDLAEGAGVGAGTLYRAFASKEGLYNAVYRAAKERLRSAILPIVLAPGDTRTKFESLFRALTDFAANDPFAFQLLELQAHGGLLDRESRAVENSVLEPLAVGVKSLQASGELRRDVRADVLMALVWGAIVGLVKAEREGYLTLDDAARAGAESSIWALCAPLEEKRHADDDVHRRQAKPKQRGHDARRPGGEDAGGARSAVRERKRSGGSTRARR